MVLAGGCTLLAFPTLTVITQREPCDWLNRFSADERERSGGKEKKKYSKITRYFFYSLNVFLFVSLWW